MPSIYNSNLADLPTVAAQVEGIEAILIERPRPEPGAITIRESAEVRDEDAEEALLDDAMEEVTGEEPEKDPSSTVQRMATEPPLVPRDDLMWKFLVNPQAIQFGGGDAQYEELLPHLNTVPEVAFKGNSARTIELPDLILETWFEGKSVQPLLDGIRRLQEANPDNREYEPPTMAFVFGSRRIEPVKVVKATWIENKWLGGEPAGVRLSLTLQEVMDERVSDPYEPPPPPIETEGETETTATTESIDPIALTPRQMDEFATAARQWLKDNATTQGFSAVVAYTLNQQDFKLKPQSNGIATVADVTGAALGKVGTWGQDSILEEWTPELLDLPKA